MVSSTKTVPAGSHEVNVFVMPGTSRVNLPMTMAQPPAMACAESGEPA